MKEGRKTEHTEKTPVNKLQKMPHTKAILWHWDQHQLCFATLVRLLTDRVMHIWAFPNTTIPSSDDTDTETSVPNRHRWHGKREATDQRCVHAAMHWLQQTQYVHSYKTPYWSGSKASDSRVADQGPISWRPTTVKWRQSSQSNRHSIIGTRQTEYYEELPSLADDEVRYDCTFADDDNASWYLACWMQMVE